jgi:hypothetical protein
MADRLVAALLAGQAAGGDRRQQSAALSSRESGGWPASTTATSTCASTTTPADRLVARPARAPPFTGTTAEADLLAFDEPLTRRSSCCQFAPATTRGRRAGCMTT